MIELIYLIFTIVVLLTVVECIKTLLTVNKGKVTTNRFDRVDVILNTLVVVLCTIGVTLGVIYKVF